MTFVLAWARLELRRRWRTLVVLALLVALATAAVLTAVAGARRGDTAEQRLRERTLPADLVVLPSDPAFRWDVVRAMPEVGGVAVFLDADFSVEGLPDAQGPVYFVPTDDEAMRTVERPVVIDGRLADPARVDEAVVTPRFVESYGLGVGDAVTYRLHTPEGMDASLAEDADVRPAGPKVRARIVGVVRSLWFSDAPGYQGGLVPSAALFQRHRSNLVGSSGTVPAAGLVRLEGGGAAVPAFQRRLAAVTNGADVDVWNLGEGTPLVEKEVAFDGAGLLAFALAALAAAVVLVGQVLVRYVAATVDDLYVLRAVGLRPGQTVFAGVIAPALAGTAGGTLGVTGAVVASSWLPVGAASVLEPAPGADVDLLVLAVGWVVAPLLLVAGTAAAVWASTRSGRSPARRRSTLTAAAARAGLPVPLVTGMRFALEKGRGRGAPPVRPTLVAAAVGVLGVVAVFTFSAGVADASGNPARFGLTYELEGRIGEGGENVASPERVADVVTGDRDVVGVNDARVGVARAGARTIRLYAYEPVGPPVGVVLTAGRMPTSPTEVVLGPHTASVLDVSVGASTWLTGSEGPRRVTVTGIGFVPGGDRNYYFDGGWLTSAGYARLFDGFESHLLQVDVRDGADPARVAARLQSRTAAVAGGAGISFEPPMAPAEIAYVEAVRYLPFLLGGFLGLLAVGAVGHALTSAVRRRRKDVAVLRALGMTRWQCRGVVVAHASVVAVVGVVVGLPLGVALGRTLWRTVADYTPLAYHPPFAGWALLLVGPAALLVAVALATWPARNATRRGIGEVLRAE